MAHSKVPTITTPIPLCLKAQARRPVGAKRREKNPFLRRELRREPWRSVPLQLQAIPSASDLGANLPRK